MTPDERKQLRKELDAKIKRWPARLNRLANRKNEPLSESQFCDKYGINKGNFNRAKNFVVEARPKRVNEVEQALAAEGV